MNKIWLLTSEKETININIMAAAEFATQAKQDIDGRIIDYEG